MIRTAFKVFQGLFMAVLCLALISADCCKPDIPVSKSGWNVIGSEAFTPLGHEGNKLSITNDFYAGHNVDTFRLKIKIPRNILFNTGGGRWFDGLTITVSTPDGEIVESVTHESDDTTDLSFWTPDIPGNRARIFIWSTKRLDTPKTGIHIPEGYSCVIDSIAYYWDDSYPEDYAPSRSDLASLPADNHSQAAKLTLNHEMKGFLTPRATDHYYVVLDNPGTYAVYVSPISTATAHDVGLIVGCSRDDFVLPMWSQDDQPGVLHPEEFDTGIYYEFEVPSSGDVAYVRDTLFLTVRSVTPLRHDYIIVVNRVKERFDLTVEMEDGLADRDAPAQPNQHANQEIQLTDPYIYNKENYVWDNATYLRRAKEVFVLGTAKMLGSTEGHFRFDDVYIYKTTHWYLNSDVIFYDSSGRANAFPLAEIHMYRNFLDEPISGGAVLNHEWGHYEYLLFDEYMEIYTEIDTVIIDLDNNCIMCNHENPEFCTYYNNDVSSCVGIYMLTNLIACWTMIIDRYDDGIVFPPGHWGDDYVYPSEQGRYEDVLHSLERNILKFTYFN